MQVSIWWVPAALFVGMFSGAIVTALCCVASLSDSAMKRIKS